MERKEEEILISRARPEEAGKILEYLQKAGGETENLSFGAEGFPMSLEEERRCLEELKDSSDSVMFVAKKNGRIVGNASFSRMKGERLKHRGSFGISVLKAEWRQGIGSRLLESVLDFAKNTAGAEIISLEVRSDNTGAIALYEKYGFEKIGFFQGFFKIRGQFVDFDLMNLYL